MDDARFWDLVEQSRTSRNQAKTLTTLLAALPADEIVAFDKIFDRHMASLYRWDLWAVSYIIQGGSSDDGFESFCAWIIGQGAASYNQAVQDARSYGLSIPVADGEFDGEALLYASASAYEAAAGKELPPRRSVRPASPMGEPWEEDEVDARYPELSKKWNDFHEHGIGAEVKAVGGGVAGFFKKLFGK